MEAVRAVLPRPSTRERPDEVEVSRPSDALAAKRATDDAFTGLLLGLGAVALLVGGVGVANTMVISVLERRARSACAGRSAPPGARSAVQFLTESLLLSALGGLAGAVLGAAGHRRVRHLPGLAAGRPAWAVAGGSAAPC